MIAGTIEFDVDPNVAIWLDEWRRSGRGHRRKASSLSDSGASITGGKRQLRLVKKVEDAKSRNERLDPHSVASLNGGRSRAATSSISSERSLQEADLNVRFGDRTGRRLSIQHPLPGLISVSPSMDQFTESDQTKDTIDPSLLAPEIVEVDGRNIEDLLASPIELDKVRLERVRMADGPKRGSGLVMAEELDDLERSESKPSTVILKLTTYHSHALVVTTGNTRHIPSSFDTPYDRQNRRCESPSLELVSAHSIALDANIASCKGPSQNASSPSAITSPTQNAPHAEELKWSRRSDQSDSEGSRQTQLASGPI